MAKRPSNVTQEAGPLAELDFVDLYVPLHDGIPARFNSKVGLNRQIVNMPVPDDYELSLQYLAEAIRGLKKDEASLNFEGMRMRVSRKQMANGERWACVRRIETDIPSLETLKFPRRLVPYLRQLGTRSGLVLVSGATGQGKTTTINCFLGEWLRSYGQVAVTIEDPVEYALHGEMGETGFCYQIEVDEDRDWAESLKTALRWHPRFILVGEIRTAAAAAQLLRAANSGHLVISTMHSNGIEEALSGLVQIAEPELGDRAQTLLGDSLVAVFHQTLTAIGPQLRFLFTKPSEDGTDPIRGSIREGRFQMLNTYIKQQEAKIYSSASER